MPWVRLCGAALEAAAVASVDGVNTDVSEFVDLASVSWPCLVAATPCQREGSRIAFAQAKATPRVDVAETPKETMELEMPECRFPVFVRTFSGTRTLHTLLVSQSTAVLETSFYLTFQSQDRGGWNWERRFSGYEGSSTWWSQQQGDFVSAVS